MNDKIIRKGSKVIKFYWKEVETGEHYTLFVVLGKSATFMGEVFLSCDDTWIGTGAECTRNLCNSKNLSYAMKRVEKLTI